MVLITELIESALSSKDFLSALVSTIIVRKWLKNLCKSFLMCDTGTHILPWYDC